MQWLGTAVWSLSLATLWHTRPERTLVLASVATVLAVELLWAAPPRRLLRALAARAAPPLAVILISSLALRGANRVAYGAFVEQDLLSSSFTDAMGQLLRIATPTARRYVGVPEDARRLAYSVSPSFRRLEPLLEGEVKKQWTISSCQSLAICDDFANGWSHFAFRDAAARTGVHRDAPTAEAFYAALAGEIRTACRTGTLPCRAAGLPYVDRRLLALLPASFAKVAERTVFPRQGIEHLSERPAVPAWVAQTFDEVALRRTALPNAGRIEVAGWAFGTDGAPVRSVRLESAAGRTLGELQPLLARELSPAILAAPPLTGYVFALRKQQRSPELPGARLVFTLNDLTTVSVPVARDDGTYAVRFSVDIAREDIPSDPAQTLRSWLAGAYRYALLGSLMAALLAFASHLIRHRAHALRPRNPLGAFVVLCAATVVLRLAYFAAVDAFLIPVSLRFVYPVVGLTGAAACLALSALGRGRDTLAPPDAG